MKRKINIMPAVMSVISALYLILVISSEDTILAADAIGGDPGGKVLPIFMSFFMFVGFLYLAFKDKDLNEPMHPVTKRLFIFTLVSSILYVLLIRYIGFIIMSTLLLYSMEYVYTTVGKERNNKEMIYGGLATTGLTTLIFYGMRNITKTLLRMAMRKTLPPIFSVASFQALISIAYVLLIAFILYKTIYKKLKAQSRDEVASAGFLTIIIILLLYVVFKQFFSVNLAPGILNF